MAIRLEKGSPEWIGVWGESFNASKMIRPVVPGSIATEVKIRPPSSTYYYGIPEQFQQGARDLPAVAVNSLRYTDLRTRCNKSEPDAFFTSVFYLVPYGKFGASPYFGLSPAVVNTDFFSLPARKVDIINPQDTEIAGSRVERSDDLGIIEVGQRTASLEINTHHQTDDFQDLLPYAVIRTQEQTHGLMSYFGPIMDGREWFGRTASKILLDLEVGAEIEAMEHALHDGRLERYLQFYLEKQSLGEISAEMINIMAVALSDLRSRYHRGLGVLFMRNKPDDFDSWQAEQYKTWRPRRFTQDIQWQETRESSYPRLP